MHEFLAQSLGAVIAAFLVTAMFSLGLDLTLRQIAEPLRDLRLVARSLGVNVVLVPLTAIGVTSVIPIAEPLRIGIVVYALCAGTEGGPKFVHVAGGNTAFAVGLLAVLLAITVTGVPWVISSVVPDVPIDRGRLLVSLLVTIAAPLSAGLFLSARHTAIAVRLRPVMHRLSMTLLLLLFAQIIYVNFDEILSLPARALVAALLLFALAFGAGYLFGGPEAQNRTALAIMTFARNGSVAMMIAGQVFADEPKVLVMATVMAALSVVLAVPVVLMLRRLNRAPQSRSVP